MTDVLIASDDPDVIENVCSTLEGPDCTIRSVPSGYDVVPAVRATRPDLVVLDLQIGSMGGMATCMEIRLEEGAGRLPHVPVLILLDRRPDVFMARRCGADGWLLKAIDPVRLRRAVRALLDGGEYHDVTGLPATSALETRPDENEAGESAAVG